MLAQRLPQRFRRPSCAATALVALIACAPAAAAEPSDLKVTPKQVNFGTKPVGTENLARATVTNRTSTGVLLLVTATRSPDDFGFGLFPGSTCPALEPALFGPGESCDAVVAFRPSEFFAGQRQVAELTATARDPVTGEITASEVIPFIGKGAL